MLMMVVVMVVLLTSPFVFLFTSPIANVQVGYKRFWLVGGEALATAFAPERLRLEQLQSGLVEVGHGGHGGAFAGHAGEQVPGQQSFRAQHVGRVVWGRQGPELPDPSPSAILHVLHETNRGNVLSAETAHQRLQRVAPIPTAPFSVLLLMLTLPFSFGLPPWWSSPRSWAAVSEVACLFRSRVLLWTLVLLRCIPIMTIAVWVKVTMHDLIHDRVVNEIVASLSC
jgi:hypothetical protein